MGNRENRAALSGVIVDGKAVGNRTVGGLFCYKAFPCSVHGIRAFRRVECEFFEIAFHFFVETDGILPALLHFHHGTEFKTSAVIFQGKTIKELPRFGKRSVARRLLAVVPQVPEFRIELPCIIGGDFLSDG
ncbi:hypothetical protein SDC9_185628 [bioreactor metagenome]|uniref:Uncharacterized protein n=1 Tax=bioreactor metagenome TaxID=1076179 RepID=A0A645HPQ6_9ZZZZ